MNFFLKGLSHFHSHWQHMKTAIPPYTYQLLILPIFLIFLLIYNDGWKWFQCGFSLGWTWLKSNFLSILQFQTSLWNSQDWPGRKRNYGQGRYLILRKWLPFRVEEIIWTCLCPVQISKRETKGFQTGPHPHTQLLLCLGPKLSSPEVTTQGVKY